MFLIKLLSIALIFVTTLAAGVYPFFRKINLRGSLTFPIGESLAAGVFLGAGLLHMLSNASSDFYHLSYRYPFAPLLVGLMFLFLLFLEHVGREIVETQGDASGAFAILATVMLSIHSFFEGAALGIAATLPFAILMLLAILAHKWVEGFSLAVQINKSAFSNRTNIMLFSAFALMTPIGILTGEIASNALQQCPLLQPIFSALAAGTFLYLGTLHGLEKATLIKQCCDLHHFYFVILGFAIMAVAAIWA